MEKKQTAVDWYFDKIKSHFEHDGDLFETACFTYAIAKEKEKEEMEKCYEHGNLALLPTGHADTFEEYYNETYGKETNRS